MRRKSLFFFVLLIGCALCFPTLAESMDRVLLVGCDNFVSQVSTAPSSANNVTQMMSVLSGGDLDPVVMVTRRNDLYSKEALERLILETFADADEDDVSFFYISTHGLWKQGQANGSMTLLLSDGVREDGITASELKETFDQIKGTKVLIVDACHSGAMLGKGVHPPFDNVFVGKDYKVICSSGGAEESWFWAGNEDASESAGAGYFSSALVRGLSYLGAYGADANRDGHITMTELKNYLLENHGASTTRMYPEEDDFVILSYNTEVLKDQDRTSIVSSLTFSGDTLTDTIPTVNFSFTMLTSARIAYQTVMHRDGKWDFEHSNLVWDNSELYGEFGDAQGFLSPGYKERTFTFSRDDTVSYGYVLMQMLAIRNNSVSMISSRVLTIPPLKGDPLLEVYTGEHFTPQNYEEMNILVHHQFPCEISVTIEDEAGSTVRRICTRQGSRPEQMKPLGSTFCWNGKTSSGEYAPAGTYKAHITAWIAGVKYEMVSDPFELVGNAG